MILFDLDGTLWDSSEQVAQAWNMIFRQSGKGTDLSIRETESTEGTDLPEYAEHSEHTEGSLGIPDLSAAGICLPVLTADDIRNVMGKTMEEIAQITLPDLEAEIRRALFKICETFEVSYIETRGGNLFPEVRETLTRLKAQGYEMAIVSNCQVGYVRAFLTSMKMEPFFCDYEEWGRTGMSKAENIRLVMERNNCTKAVYVGDTQKDKDAANQAGIPFIWASYGFGSVDGCAYKLEHFPELLSVSDKFLK